MFLLSQLELSCDYVSAIDLVLANAWYKFKEIKTINQFLKGVLWSQHTLQNNTAQSPSLYWDYGCPDFLDFNHKHKINYDSFIWKAHTCGRDCKNHKQQQISTRGINLCSLKLFIIQLSGIYKIKYFREKLVLKI